MSADVLTFGPRRTSRPVETNAVDQTWEQAASLLRGLTMTRPLVAEVLLRGFVAQLERITRWNGGAR